MTRQGKFVVIAGPSAVGKDTVAQAYISQAGNAWMSVSVTTREPRPGEVDGVDYTFIDKASFWDLKDRNELLEWAVVHGESYYGTPRAAIVERLNAGQDVLAILDVQGVAQVRNSMPEATFVFIAPPSWDELMRRLKGRGTETVAQIERRLKSAHKELALRDTFDHVVVNDSVEDAVAELRNIIRVAK